MAHTLTKINTQIDDREWFKVQQHSSSTPTYWYMIGVKPGLLFIKNNKGDIRTYQIREILQDGRVLRATLVDTQGQQRKQRQQRQQEQQGQEHTTTHK